jgi:hypothetical protein
VRLSVWVRPDPYVLPFPQTTWIETDRRELCGFYRVFASFSCIFNRSLASCFKLLGLGFCPLPLYNRGFLTSSPPSAIGCRLRGKGVNSSSETATSGRENVNGGVDVTVVIRTAYVTGPFSYSKTCDTFRPRARLAARTGLG